MIRLIFGFFTLFLIFSCGGDGDNPTPISTNSSGFPDVVGRYSFNTTAISVSCSDGYLSSNPAFSHNFDITQDVNVITLIDENAGDVVPGVTILEVSDFSGNVQKDATFIANQSITAEVVDIVGAVHFAYGLSGKFTNFGWSGAFEYTATTSLVSCDYRTTYAGDKITPALAKAQADTGEKGGNLGVDTYDYFWPIGAVIGAENRRY